MQVLAAQVQGGWTAQATATVVGAGLVLVGAAVGVGQKWRTDRREHWWLRTQWAIEQLDKGEEARTIALEVLRSQGRSKLASADDQTLFDDIATVVLDEVAEEQ